MPGEGARVQGQDPSHGGGPERAGKERDGKQIPSAGACAAPGLLQELPRFDVRGMFACDVS